MSDYPVPIGLKADEVESLLARAKRETSLAARINLISSHFLGRPYVADSLIGGPDQQEVFISTLDGFDCVTYIEAVLALAISRSVIEFNNCLRNIRYEDGKIDWFHRNHYMTCWAMNNEKRGTISLISTGPGTIDKLRTLNVVKGLPPKTVNLRYLPKHKARDIRKNFQTGDIVLFVSTKKRLDVFHMGLLIVDNNKIFLRHAARSEGRVVEQPFDDFLKNNRMSGFILLRPLCQR